MSLRWILLILVVAFAVDAFSAVQDFNQMIAQTEHDQRQLAQEIHSQVNDTNEKALESLSQSELHALKGFNLKIY